MSDTLAPPGQATAPEKVLATPTQPAQRIDALTQRDLIVQALKNPRTSTDQLAQIVNTLAKLTTKGDPEGVNKGLRINAVNIPGITVVQIPPYMRQMLSASGIDANANIGNLNRVEVTNERITFTFSNGAFLDLSTTKDILAGRVVQIFADRTAVGGNRRSARFTEKDDTGYNTNNVHNVLGDTALYLTHLHTEAVDSLPDNDPAKQAYLKTTGELINTVLPQHPREALRVVAGETQSTTAETATQHREAYAQICDTIRATDPTDRITVSALLECRSAFGLGDMTFEQLQQALVPFDLQETYTAFIRTNHDDWEKNTGNNAVVMRNLEYRFNQIPDPNVKAFARILFGQVYIMRQLNSLIDTNNFSPQINLNTFFNRTPAGLFIDKGLDELICLDNKTFRNREQGIETIRKQIFTKIKNEVLNESERYKKRADLLKNIN
jgi:hypothetical protein